MARLNLTIPDALYARYQRVRRQINVSKVCAEALEIEVTRIERFSKLLESPKARALFDRLIAEELEG